MMGKDHMKHLGVDGRIILRQILERYIMNQTDVA
jgi:hypothetical protein